MLKSITFFRDTLYIYFAWVNVSLYPLNVQTAELIGPKLCMATNMTPGNNWKLELLIGKGVPRVAPYRHGKRMNSKFSCCNIIGLVR